MSASKRRSNASLQQSMRTFLLLHRLAISKTAAFPHEWGGQEKGEENSGKITRAANRPCPYQLNSQKKYYYFALGTAAARFPLHCSCCDHGFRHKNAEKVSQAALSLRINIPIHILAAKVKFLGTFFNKAIFLSLATLFSGSRQQQSVLSSRSLLVQKTVFSKKGRKIAERFQPEKSTSRLRKSFAATIRTGRSASHIAIIAKDPESPV